MFPVARRRVRFDSAQVWSSNFNSCSFSCFNVFPLDLIQGIKNREWKQWKGKENFDSSPTKSTEETRLIADNNQST